VPHSPKTLFVREFYVCAVANELETVLLTDPVSQMREIGTA